LVARTPLSRTSFVSALMLAEGWTAMNLFKLSCAVGAVATCAGAAVGDGPIVLHGVEFVEAPDAMSIETDDGWRFEPAGDGQWAAWGWQDASGEGAAAYMMWYYQDDEMFMHAGDLVDVDWSGETPAEAPVVLRFGFDAGSPFQPVLE